MGYYYKIYGNKTKFINEYKFDIVQRNNRNIWVVKNKTYNNHKLIEQGYVNNIS